MKDISVQISTAKRNVFAWRLGKVHNYGTFLLLPSLRSTIPTEVFCMRDKLKRATQQKRKISELLLRTIAFQFVILMVLIAPASAAFAGQTGESSKFTLELVGCAPLATQFVRHEARHG